MTGFDRNRRFSIMAQAGTGSDDLLILAEQVLADSGDAVTVVTPPRVGMMMLRLREPVNGTVFNAGEVLVTEAQIALGVHQGYAMRLGREPEADTRRRRAGCRRRGRAPTDVGHPGGARHTGRGRARAPTRRLGRGRPDARRL
jgi:hypothetical protein